MSKHIIEVKFQLILSGEGEIDIKVGSMRIHTYERVENDPRFRAQQVQSHTRGVLTTTSSDPNRAVEAGMSLPWEFLRLFAFHFAPSVENGKAKMSGESRGGEVIPQTDE